MMSKIQRLQVFNFMRIESADIEAGGDNVILSGANAQGKSSILKAIAAVIGGAGNSPDRPIRRGANKSEIILTLDDMEIYCSEKGTGARKLVVRGADGKKLDKPATRLKELYSSLSFDPLEFSRMDSKKQAQTIRDLVGLDFTELDKERAANYEERKDLNRELKKVAAQLGASKGHKGAPEKEVAISDLLAEIKRIDGVNQTNRKRRNDLNMLRDEAAVVAGKVDRLKKELVKTESELAAINTRGQKLKAEVEAMKDEDSASVQDEIEAIEDTNRKVRENNQHLALKEEHKALDTKVGKLNATISEIDAKKQNAIQSAKYPVDGLTVFDDAIYYNDVPLAQASQGESLTISSAICAGLNPELRVMLVHDGSLLDAERKADLLKFADQNNMQLWLEVVGNEEEATVVIEDGLIKE